MDSIIHVIGILLLITGFLKLIVGLSGLVLPLETLQKLHDLPFAGGFFTLDVTTAGKALEVSVVCFALYSILKGVYMLRWYDHQTINMLATSHFVTYTLYGSLGVALTLFYATVVYAPREEVLKWLSFDESKRGSYKLFGIGSGIMLLILGVAMHIYHTRQSLSMKDMRLYSAILALLITALIYIIMYSYDELKKRHYDALITSAMMFLGAT